jgi:predicted amidophosphoribosyltransferase
MRALLKAGDASFISKYALRVRQQAKDLPLWRGFFGATDILVPVPRSTPYVAGGLWAAEDLARALVKAGLGGAAWSGLRRVHAVRKSSTAAPSERPTVNLHYESFSIERSPIEPARIVLVDDVITKGRTLLAAASRVHDAFPYAQIRAFALVRTMGLISGVEQLLDPCMGEIRWRSGDAHRNP